VFPEKEADLDAIFELPALVEELAAAVQRARNLGTSKLEPWRSK
jgi:hypothetical protein